MCIDSVDLHFHDATSYPGFHFEDCMPTLMWIMVCQYHDNETHVAAAAHGLELDGGVAWECSCTHYSMRRNFSREPKP